MDETGPPLVTPFDADSGPDGPALGELVEWVEARGVGFVVPCESNGELGTTAERARTIDVLVGGFATLDVDATSA